MTDSAFSLLERAGLDREVARQAVADALSGADDGELFLEYLQSEALQFDNGRLKSASFDTNQGFGLRAIAGEAAGYAHSAEISEAAIRRAGEKPFFIQINFVAPHDPLHWPPGRENAIDYRTLPLPANFRAGPAFDTGNVAGRDERIVPAPRTADEVKQERAIYFSLVENVDRQVGRIVQALEEGGQLPHTVIIVTSDHGLALGSHGLMGKQNQYDHTINVPLVMAGPGIPAGQRFAAQCYLRDLYPTVCELTGVVPPPSVQGQSLVPVLRGQKTEVRDAIFGYFTDTQRMMRSADGWKLIWYPKIEKVQLFNVVSDPDEIRDLADDAGQAERLERMKKRLGEWQREHHDPVPPLRLALRRP